MNLEEWTIKELLVLYRSKHSEYVILIKDERLVNNFVWKEIMEIEEKIISLCKEE